MKLSRDIKFFLGVQVLLLVLAFIGYKLFSALLLKMIYDGDYSLFSNLINKIACDSFDSYAWKAGQLFCEYYWYCVCFVLCEIACFANVRKRLTKIFFIIVSFGLLAYSIRFNSLAHGLSRYEYYGDEDSRGNLTYPEFTKRQIVQLGWAKADYIKGKSFYTEHLREKKAGVIRIGVFGSSPEVVGLSGKKKGYDYPSLLDDKFKEAGMSNVEIVNFSVGAYGAAQCYLMWQFIGKHYDLDYVIFVLKHSKRANTFAWGDIVYGPLSARYILEDDIKLKMLSVSGNSRSEACDIYWRWIPPFKYLYYDANLPMFLRPFIPEKFHNRTNPFYFKRNVTAKKDVYPIYQKIIEEWARHVKNMIVVGESSDAEYLAGKINASNVDWFAPQANQCLRSFLFFEHKVHFNGLANTVFADELFSFLTGNRKIRFNDIELSCALFDINNVSKVPSQGLYEFRNVMLASGQYPVADFITGLDQSAHGFPEDMTLKFRDLKIASLLMLPMTEQKNIKFLPLSFSLKNDEAVFLAYRMWRRFVKIPIGKIKATGGIIGVLELDGLKDGIVTIEGGADCKLQITDYKVFVEKCVNADDACILVGDRKILAEPGGIRKRVYGILRRFIFPNRTQRAKLEPVNCEYAYLRSQHKYFVDAEPIKAERGDLDLVLTNDDGSEIRYPLFCYKFIPRETVPLEKTYEKLVSSGKLRYDSVEK